MHTAMGKKSLCFSISGHAPCTDYKYFCRGIFLCCTNTAYRKIIRFKYSTKSTKYDLNKRSASNVNCNDLNNAIPSPQAILNYPESSVCDITYTYSQETEATTHDDMGTLEISGSSSDGQLNSDGYVEAETFAKKEVDSEAWLGDHEPLDEDSNSECSEISLDLDSDSEMSEFFSESEESEVSEENKQCGNSSVDVDDTTEHRILSDMFQDIT